MLRSKRADSEPLIAQSPSAMKRLTKKKAPSTKSSGNKSGRMNMVVKALRLPRTRSPETKESSSSLLNRSTDNALNFSRLEDRDLSFISHAKSEYSMAHEVDIGADLSFSEPYSLEDDGFQRKTTTFLNSSPSDVMSLFVAENHKADTHSKEKRGFIDAAPSLDLFATFSPFKNETETETFTSDIDWGTARTEEETEEEDNEDQETGPKEEMRDATAENVASLGTPVFSDHESGTSNHPGSPSTSFDLHSSLFEEVKTDVAPLRNDKKSVQRHLKFGDGDDDGEHDIEKNQGENANGHDQYEVTQEVEDDDRVNNTDDAILMEKTKYWMNDKTKQQDDDSDSEATPHVRNMSPGGEKKAREDALKLLLGQEVEAVVRQKMSEVVPDNQALHQSERESESIATNTATYTDGTCEQEPTNDSTASQNTEDSHAQSQKSKQDGKRALQYSIASKNPPSVAEADECDSTSGVEETGDNSSHALEEEIQIDSQAKKLIPAKHFSQSMQRLDSSLSDEIKEKIATKAAHASPELSNRRRRKHRSRSPSSRSRRRERSNDDECSELSTPESSPTKEKNISSRRRRHGRSRRRSNSESWMEDESFRTSNTNDSDDDDYTFAEDDPAEYISRWQERLKQGVRYLTLVKDGIAGSIMCIGDAASNVSDDLLVCRGRERTFQKTVDDTDTSFLSMSFIDSAISKDAPDEHSHSSDRADFSLDITAIARIDTFDVDIKETQP